MAPNSSVNREQLEVQLHPIMKESNISPGSPPHQYMPLQMGLTFYYKNENDIYIISNQIYQCFWTISILMLEANLKPGTANDPNGRTGFAPNLFSLTNTSVENMNSSLYIV